MANPTRTLVQPLSRPEGEPGRAAHEAGPPPAGHEPLEEGLQRLDPRVKKIWGLGLLGRTAFFAVAALVGERFVALPVPAGALPIVVVVVGLALAIFWPRALYGAWGFRIRTDDLYVRRGVVWRAASVIPHRRIQHVDTQSGPIERALGLAQVVIYTAGVRGADVTIPGLARPDAESLRDRLAALGGVDDGV